MIVAIGLTDWPQFARVARGATLVEAEKEYVQAAKLIGLPKFTIILRHILPNTLRPVLVIATLGLALAIIGEATLSFLGQGIPPTTPSLGTLIRVGNEFLFSGLWWITLFPAIALNKVSLAVAKGEVLGLVGERGAGKSTVGNSVINLLEPPGLISGGEIIFDGTRIDQLSNEEMRKLRGTKIGTIFQDPQTSLNPLMTIGKQLSETLIETLKISGASAREKSIELLDSVGIPDPEPRLDAYPHQFSGGMRQRVMIAIGLACEPDLIIADEPTTALDVTIQAQILELLKDICNRLGVAIIMITHRLSNVINANKILVFEKGDLTEQGDHESLLKNKSVYYSLLNNEEK